MDDFNATHGSQVGPSSSQFKLDEGFAEDSHQHGDQIQNSFLAWLNTQSDKAKAEIAYEILRTLRSTDISSVVDRLNPLLHMDPIDKLPPEITSQIFSYLDASTLLVASLSSQTWRNRILDPQLWYKLYGSQGWGINLKEVKAFEQANFNLVQDDTTKPRTTSQSMFPYKGHSSFKRRATSDWLQSTPRRVSADVANWREQHGTIEADAEIGDAEMTDAPLGSPQRPNKRPSQNEGEDMDYRRSSDLSTGRDINMTGAPSSSTDLVCLDGRGEESINWPYIYKQRHKLEMNWIRGRFVNFQLPHPAYPQEAHTECVYTIQFFGKWLVSGSRDKTLRVWDLDTRRLRGKPLVGHSQSVLCLQFDPTEEEDTIISGSSDSSIIIWKFSTGQKLQTIPSAHEESVLNLRFDHRYLVTCSKDKKIKVWNRRSLLPGDPDYPIARPGASCKIPNHIVDLSDVDISMLEARLAAGVYKALKPFSHLMTFEGHSAAVNAIQIEDDKIVSASGDRHIRIWNIKTGTCPRVIPGHQKGIACVQYDGIRVVSGSSDNTVRIYDPITSSEVAVLVGHTNLVRTVQAGFGDVPGSVDEYLSAAQSAEKDLYHKFSTGALVDDRAFSRRLRNNEYGSSRVTFGSKLPPGGGGSRWARIVSGSYDETIIIWKKDARGNWIVGQTLKQDESMQANIENDTTAQITRRRPRIRHRDLPQQDANDGPTSSANAINNSFNSHVSASQIVQATVNTSLSSLQTSVQNLIGVNSGINGFIPGGYGPLLNHLQEARTQRSTSNVAQASSSSSRPSVQHQNNHMGTNVNTTTTSTSTSTPTGGPAPSQTQGPAAAAPPPGNFQSNSNSVSRVFKLQFDARRIVCCSQDSRIIGWDFANDDPDIEACSKFFLGP